MSKYNIGFFGQHQKKKKKKKNMETRNVDQRYFCDFCNASFDTGFAKGGHMSWCKS